jgi:hypothetical protein
MIQMNKNDMIIGNASIQKNESKWIVEWLAWQQLQGVNKWYIYNHESEDNTKEIYEQLSKHYDITITDVTGNFCHYPMMQHMLDNYRSECDWLIYNDTDEFMFPVQPDVTVRDILWQYWDMPNSALGIYWTFFGSNGHDELGDDPDIVTQSYTARSHLDEIRNRHMKSIVRGRGQGGQIQATNPHVFTTEFGTIDLAGRPILPHQGWNKDGIPSHDIMRINHYWNKSYHWFHYIKHQRGYRFDRPVEDQNFQLEHWAGQNFNDVYDNSLWERWGDQLLAKMDEIQSHLTIKPNMYSRLGL